MLRQVSPLLSIMFAALAVSSSVSAGAFGEAAVAVGGTWPQGNFTRYADPGFLVSGRATIHIPSLEFASAWVGAAIGQFEEDKSSTNAYIPGGPSVPVDQTVSENLIGGFIGLQINSATQRAFFRPRAALGVGLYRFTTTTTWTFDTEDTTIELDSRRDDSQTCFGWRGMLGADFFIKSDLGLSADFIYDHVLDLNQTTTPLPEDQAHLTSRFHGFSVGLVYMFST